MSLTSQGTLGLLADTGPLRISELAEREGASQPGMTALVNRLADAGHVRRMADPSDRRATLVEITPSGRQTLQRLRAERMAVLVREIAKLPAQHRRALARAIAAIDCLTAAASAERSDT